jgi:hypothetical protein
LLQELLLLFLSLQLGLCLACWHTLLVLRLLLLHLLLLGYLTHCVVMCQASILQTLGSFCRPAGAASRACAAQHVLQGRPCSAAACHLTLEKQPCSEDWEPLLLVILLVLLFYCRLIVCGSAVTTPHACAASRDVYYPAGACCSSGNS